MYGKPCTGFPGWVYLPEVVHLLQPLGQDREADREQPARSPSLGCPLKEWVGWLPSTSQARLTLCGFEFGGQSHTSKEDNGHGDSQCSQPVWYA